MGKRTRHADNIAIGNRLFNWQLEHHKSDEFMTDLLGLSNVSSYKRILFGETELDSKKLIILKKHLGINLDWLIAGEDDISVKNVTVDYTIEGVERFIVETFPDARENFIKLIAEMILNERDRNKS